MQWPVVHTLFQGKMDHHNQKDGSREAQKIGPVLESYDPVACMANMELRLEFGL